MGLLWLVRSCVRTTGSFLPYSVLIQEINGKRKPVFWHVLRSTHCFLSPCILSKGSKYSEALYGSKPVQVQVHSTATAYRVKFCKLSSKWCLNP